MFRYVFLIIVFYNFVFANSVIVLSSANLKFLFSDIVKKYSEIYPKDKINVNFASSGNITKDIINGKKYDIFLAANMIYPQKVYDAKKAATKPTLYTTGSLVLLIAKHKGLKNRNINILIDEDIKEITIANKKTAPYGMAAIEALKNSGIYNKIESKLFYSTNASNIIGDVLWYGHAGILPRSSIGFLPRGYNVYGENWVDIDENLYTPLKQYFVVSKEGLKNNATKRFTKFLLTKGQKIFKENGYK